MSSDDINRIEDNELDAFLRGEDALSQRLRALPQDEPPDALDAAILARAQQAVRPAAANDPAPAPKPLSHRWRVPAGLAAMLLVGVLTHRSWEESNQMAQVDAPAALPAPPPPPAPAPAAPAAAPVQDAAPPAEQRAQAGAAPRPAPAARPQPQAEVQAKVQAPRAQPAAPAPFAAPAPAAQPAPAPPAPAPAPMANRLSESTISHAGNVTPQASEQVTVTGARATRAPASAPAVTPEEWLGLIEAMLDAGLKNDTLAEWEAFRAAHPDHAVDPALQERINGLRNR